MTSSIVEAILLIHFISEPFSKFQICLLLNAFIQPNHCSEIVFLNDFGAEFRHQ